MAHWPRIVSSFPRALWSPTHVRWTIDSVAAYLLVISTFYLALPHLIFFFGWLRWPYALLAAAGMVLALVALPRVIVRMRGDAVSVRDQGTDEGGLADSQATSNGQPAQDGEEFVFTRQHALMIGAICLMWLTTTGVGGFVYQDFDWEKHNTVLNSLIRKPWPVVYEIYQVNIPLVYYLGYYLPAAVVGKAAGWLWANFALFAWSLVGLSIAVLWFCVLVRRVSYSVLVIFVFFSGLDVVGKGVASYYNMWNANKTHWQHIDAWTGLWQYSANATLLNWVPHQALPGWIVTGMIVYCLVELQRREIVLLPFGLSAFWSPFVALGLVPYLVLDFLVAQEPWGTRVRRMVTVPNVVGMLAFAITAFYFSSKSGEGSPIAIQSMYGGISLAGYDGPMLDAIAFLLFFCVLEFGLYVILLYRSGAIQEEGWRWMLDITTLTLCILPWFKLGVFNDLVMRASIPALFVLAVLVARAVHDASLMRQTRVALVVVLVAGGVTAAIELRRHLEWMIEIPAPIFDEAVKPMDFVEYTEKHAFYLGQYSGALDSAFFQVAAKPPPAAGVAVAGSDEFALNDHDFLLYGNHLYLLRDTVTVPSAVAAGATFTVPWQLHFFGPSLNGVLVDPTLRLADGAGDVVWESTSWPDARPKIATFGMTPWSSAITVTVPLTTTPGIYSLQVGFHNAISQAALMAHSVPDGRAVGELVPVATLEVVPPD